MTEDGLLGYKAVAMANSEVEQAVEPMARNTRTIKHMATNTSVPSLVSI